MKYISVLAVLLAVAVAACDRGQPSGEAAPNAAGAGQAAEAPKPAAANADEGAGKEVGKPTGWSAAGMQTAEQLAGKVRAAGLACEEFEASNFGLYDEDYQRRLPLAAAIASCTTDDDEDLTFEIFEDPKHARQFIDTKQEFLCKKAENMKLEGFPGFPYVDGGAWIVEPDEKATADKLAPILGGKANMASCTKS